MDSVLTTSDLLDVWERSLNERPLQRAINLLASIHLEASLEQIKALPVGERDIRLMEIREALFGRHLTCVTSCPQCGEKLELALDLAQMRSSEPKPAHLFERMAVEVAGRSSAAFLPYTLTVEDCDIQFRLPNSADMLAIANLPTARQARQTLLERCVQQATQGGRPIAVVDLPDKVVESVSNQMAQNDPQADIQIELSCPACAWQWSAPFDIISTLWIEINAWAIRLLGDVHKIASNYGWCEADILALSPMRRQFYLEQIG